MEQELQQISLGKVTKDVVTSKFVNEYRYIFDDLSMKVDVLSKTCAKYFAQ